jgi:hypothetical protein
MTTVGAIKAEIARFAAETGEHVTAINAAGRSVDEIAARLDHTAGDGGNRRIAAALRSLRLAVDKLDDAAGQAVRAVEITRTYTERL